jgi:MBG domain/Calx-beta domain
VTYDGSATAPTNAGSYAVAAVVNDADFNGQANGTLTIQPANQQISFDALANKTVGDPDFSVSATASSNLAVSFAASGNCTVNGSQVHLITAGQCTITASQTGNANINAAAPVARTFSIGKVDQQITFDALPNKTIGDADFNVIATASSNLAVSLSALGNCTLNGNQVHLTGAGQCEITASQDGDANTNAAAPVARTFSIGKADQQITFDALTNKTVSDADFGISATASSNLTVSFAAAGNCTVNGTQVHLTGAGACTITASQDGDANTNAAAPVARAFSIGKADQQITFDALADKKFGDADFGINATASSNLAVAFSAGGNCTVAGTQVHLTGAGTCTITASQEGDVNTNAAAPVARTFSIGKVDQQITFNTLVNKTAGDADFGVNATASSNLAVVFSANGNCTVNGSQVHLTGAGQCTITASQDGDANVNAAAPVARTFVIGKTDQQITFEALADKKFGDADFGVVATASSNLAVAFSAGGNCTVTGAQVHVNGAGLCTITASQDGDANVNAAAPVARTFSIGKSDQQITFEVLADKKFGDADFGLIAAASSNLAVSLAAAGNCTLNGSQVHLTGAGICTITASQDGDANITAAVPVARTFSIGKADQQITFDGLADRKFGDPNFAVGATASSSLTVSLAATGNCTLAGSQVHLTSAGQCTITASQDGDANVNAAVPVARTFAIGKTDQQITFDALANKTIGDADLGITATSSANLVVSFAATGNCTLNGNQIHLTGAGQCTVTASQDGDANTNAATPVARTFSIAKLDQQITFDVLADKKFGDADFNVTATASSNLAVSLAAAGNCTLNGSQIHLTGAGQCTVTASQDGDANTNAAAPVVRVFSIAKSDQQITFETLADKKFGDADFNVTVSASSNLAVSLAAAGNCTLAGNQVHLTGAGQCTITASQDGDANTNAAAPVARAFSIGKSDQQITFAALADKKFGDADFALTATTASNLPVSFATTGNCTLNGSQIHLTGAGQCTITASQDGDADTNAAAPVARTFSIGKADQQITFAPPADKKFGDADFAVVATASSNLLVTLAASGNCSLNGAQIHLTGAGQCTVTASQDGDENNNAAAPVTRTFSIGKAEQQITFAAPAEKKFGEADFAVTATASSNLSVSFAASGNCTINGNQVHLTGAGQCTITASQDGDANTSAAAPVARTFAIGKSDQQITFAALPNKAAGDADFSVTATASSNLAVTFAAVGNCTLNGNQVHLTGSGQCTITASQDGDANTNAATPVARTFSIGKTDQQITFEALADRKFGDADFGVNATASSNLAVSFAAAGNCVLNGNQVHLTGAGQCTITASQDGDANTNAAAPVARTFSISKADQQITFAALADREFGEADFNVNATASSNLTVGFAASGNCTVSGSQVHLTGAGSCTITASQEGSADYNQAAAVSQTFNIAAQVNTQTLINFSSAAFRTAESVGALHITVNRSGDTSGSSTVDYATDDTGAPADCASSNGLAISRCDFNAAIGTLVFSPGETEKSFSVVINRDSRVEMPFESFTVKLSSPTGGAALGETASATVQIDDISGGLPPDLNVIDDSRTFVRQQYHDFLNREADPAGLAFWADNIDKCNDPARRPADLTVAGCREVMRISTSAAFFLSIEFQQTGNLVRSFYVAALDRPSTNNMPGFAEFLRDTQAMQLGVVVGEGDWQQTLNNNRDVFMKDFVTRAEFVGLYPTNDTPAQYVDRLYQHARVTPTVSERDNAIAEFGSATTAEDVGARGRALLRVTQDNSFQQRELNRSFVQMQYIGYLQRNPNDLPDGNFAGFEFWLQKLNRFNGNFIEAEMVKAFINSNEYRARFGP